jgi:shikimate kinase
VRAPRVLALVGLRCSGKSSLGRLWAERTGAPFADLDELLMELTGEENGSAGELLAAVGEAEFRRRETRALEEYLERDLPAVLATGGGAILTPANRKILHELCLVVWLDAPWTVLAERLRADAAVRPSLTGRDPAQELETLAEQREALYREVADLRLDATLGLDELADELVRRVDRQADGGLVLRTDA